MSPRASLSKATVLKAMAACKDPYKNVLEFYKQLSALHTRLTGKKQVKDVVK